MTSVGPEVPPHKRSSRHDVTDQMAVVNTTPLRRWSPLISAATTARYTALCLTVLTMGGNGRRDMETSEWFKEHQSPWMALMTVTNWERALQEPAGPDEPPPH